MARMTLQGLKQAAALLSAISATLATGGLALVLRLTGPYLVMGAHIYAGRTEPREASLPFPTALLLLSLGAATLACWRARRSAAWATGALLACAAGLAVELWWLSALYAAAAPMGP